MLNKILILVWLTGAECQVAPPTYKTVVNMLWENIPSLLNDIVQLTIPGKLGSEAGEPSIPSVPSGRAFFEKVDDTPTGFEKWGLGMVGALNNFMRRHQHASIPRFNFGDTFKGKVSKTHFDIGSEDKKVVEDLSQEEEEDEKKKFTCKYSKDGKQICWWS